MEVKNCPFCGGTATVYKDRLKHWVECDICGAKTSIRKNREEAITLWEQRETKNEWHSANQPGQPPVDTPLIVVVSGKPRENITLHHAIQTATWDPSDSAGWIIECWPDWAGAEVSHWMLLPDAPAEGQ